MKKISVLIMLFMSITIFIHAQELVDGEKKLTIYLVSVEQIDTIGAVTNHLYMYDSNGNMAIDSLTTVFEKTNKQKGTIFWEVKCGIKEIIEIKPKSQDSTTIIFKDGVKPEVLGKKYKLKLPDNRPFPGEAIKEAYYIKYITEDGKEETIDPYIDLKPPRN